MNAELKKDRIIYLDALRVIACIFVVMLHVSAQKFDVVAVGSHEWNAFNLYDSLTRWAVPVFVMISGALFLSPEKEISVQSLFKKNILRLAVAFVFWSGLYSLYDRINGVRLRSVAYGFITGHVHLWFVMMMAGLYIIIPILRHLVSSEKITKYYLLLWGVFSVFYPTCKYFAAYFNLKYANWMDVVLSKFQIGLICGFAGYFILGHYLHETDIPKTIRRALYILGALGFSSIVALTYFYSKQAGTRVDYFYDVMTAPVALSAAAVFVFIKYNTPGKKEGVIQKGMLLLSKCSFGIYLVHFMIMNILSRMKIHTLKLDPLISVPALTLLIFMISFIISYILNKLPVIKKYLV